jgi:hypothetical protein
MKILPQIAKENLNSLNTLGFRTSLEIATGGVLTAMLIRWITL